MRGRSAQALPPSLLFALSFQHMSWQSIAAGAGAGFLVGGPVGAVVGAGAAAFLAPSDASSSAAPAAASDASAAPAATVTAAPPAIIGAAPVDTTDTMAPGTTVAQVFATPAQPSATPTSAAMPVTASPVVIGSGGASIPGLVGGGVTQVTPGVTNADGSTTFTLPDGSTTTIYPEAINRPTGIAPSGGTVAATLDVTDGNAAIAQADPMPTRAPLRIVQGGPVNRVPLPTPGRGGNTIQPIAPGNGTSMQGVLSNMRGSALRGTGAMRGVPVAPMPPADPEFQDGFGSYGDTTPAPDGMSAFGMWGTTVLWGLGLYMAARLTILRRS